MDSTRGYENGISKETLSDSDKDRIVQDVLICSHSDGINKPFLTESETERLFTNYPSPYTYSYYYFYSFLELEAEKKNIFASKDVSFVPIILVESSQMERLKLIIDNIEKSAFFIKAPVLVVDRFYSSSVRSDFLNQGTVDMFIEVPIKKKLLLAQLNTFTRRLVKNRN